MDALKIIIGIIAVLVALFAGGCALILFGVSLTEWWNGSTTPFINFEVVILVGVIPAVIAGVVAWLCFRSKAPDPS